MSWSKNENEKVRVRSLKSESGVTAFPVGSKELLSAPQHSPSGRVGQLGRCLGMSGVTTQIHKFSIQIHKYKYTNSVHLIPKVAEWHHDARDPLKGMSGLQIQTRHHQNTSQFEDLFIPRLSTIALLRQQQVRMGSQKADRIDDVWWGGEWKLLVQYTSDTEIYSPTCPMNIYLLICSSISRRLNPANTFFKGKWKWELIAFTGDRRSMSVVDRRAFHAHSRCDGEVHLFGSRLSTYASGEA